MSRPRSVLRSARRIVGGLAFGLAALSAGLGYWVYRQFASDLPANLSAVTDYQPIRASQIWSADGELIGEFFVEKRVLLPIEQIPAADWRELARSDGSGSCRQAINPPPERFRPLRRVPAATVRGPNQVHGLFPRSCRRARQARPARRGRHRRA